MFEAGGHRISRGRSVGLVSSNEMEYASRRDSQNTASTALLHVPGGVHRTRGGMGRWSCSAFLHFSRGPIFELGEGHDCLLLQRVQ